MDEAKCTLPEAQLHAKMSAAARVLVRQRAIKAVRQQLHGQGRKLGDFSRREIGLAAEEYLATHRAELIAEVMPIVERWRAEGVFGKRWVIQNPLRDAS
jgi:hypothetical protein